MADTSSAEKISDHFSERNSFSYDDLIECANGNLFGPGNAQLPAPPLLLFDPGNPELVGFDDHVAQQIDILPTVLSYLGYDEPYVAFGNDLFDPEVNRFAITYIGGAYQLIQDRYVMHHTGSRVKGLYDYVVDPRLKDDLQESHPEVRQEMETLVWAILQQYHNRMLDDELTLKR